MARGPIQLWNERETQILIILSFTLQTFLFVFARTRRRGSSAVLRIHLWLAYLMADSTAVYTLSHLSISGSPSEHRIVVFWVPFLLLHLGSQDTITAYALEDNQLWPRHLLTLGVQASGVAYVLYKHIVGIPSLLRFSTVLMFIVGVIKYMERIWALKCATMDSIRSTINNYRHYPADLELPMRKMGRGKLDEVEIMLFAQAMLPLCMGGITNFPMQLTFGHHLHPSYLKWNWEDTLNVVETELSLMYDILYTKAVVIHTWYGYCIRVFSLLTTIASFILFQLSGNRNSYGRIDVVITYILLVGAFVLDMASVLSALGSTWTCIFLCKSGWSRLGHVIASLRRHAKFTASKIGWSGSIGQYNLSNFFRPTSVLEKMGPEDWWNKWKYSETLVISQDVKELVFKCVWKLVKMIHHPRAEHEIHTTLNNMEVGEAMEIRYPWVELPGFRPEAYDFAAWRRKKFDDALNFGDVIHEAILTWHVLTNIFLLCSDTPKDPTSSTYLKAIKVLSDYMVFLVVVRPNLIPGLELRSLYEDTSWYLRVLKNDKALRVCHTTKDKVERLAIILQNSRQMPSIICSRGTLYARLLLELADAGNPDKPAVISSYDEDYDCDHVAMDKLKRLMPDMESSCRDDVFDMPKVLVLILDTLVRLLISASVRCSREAHARQISHGGELMTVVWLMQEHASVFFDRPPGSEANIGRA